MLNNKVIQINCIGCGLCASLEKNINFKIDDAGFYRPTFPKGYNFESLSEICPIVYTETDTIKSIWGDYLEVNKAYANDDEINQLASSGGVISSILIWLMNEGIIDAVIQIGTSKKNPMENEVFVSKNKKDILWCAGSRYAPASPLLKLNECLNANLKYAFVGKPCDCRALRKYLKHNKINEEKIIVIISFFCAGTPSRNATKQLIKALEADEKSVESISYRGKGWPGYAMVVDDNGCHQMEYEKSWGSILGRTKQQFCRVCAEGTGDAADISCGDAWRLKEDYTPDFSDSNGRNIVFLRTEKGKTIFDQCVKNKILSSKMYDIDELKYIQPYQFERKITLSAQISALKILGKYAPNYSKKDLNILKKQSSLKKDCRIFLGTCKRAKNGSVK